MQLRPPFSVVDEVASLLPVASVAEVQSAPPFSSEEEGGGVGCKSSEAST